MPSAGNLKKTHLLAADRVYLFLTSPPGTVGSYPTRFTFTHEGSFVSVALSLGLPPVAVSDCLSLRCPDFPPLSERLADNLTYLL